MEDSCDKTFPMPVTDLGNSKKMAGDFKQKCQELTVNGVVPPLGAGGDGGAVNIGPPPLGGGGQGSGGQGGLQVDGGCPHSGGGQSGGHAGASLADLGGGPFSSPSSCPWALSGP